MSASSSDPLLEIADDLYALPLADFTPARDALVKEHKADKRLAASIKGLRKASVAAWVVNLLVRRDPDQVDQVLAVGEALRDAQDNLDATQLREFTKQRPQLHVVPDPDADANARAAADERLADARAVLKEHEKEHRAARRSVEKLQ